MKYYEIQFFGEGHEKDLTYYIESEKAHSSEGIRKRLKEDFLVQDSNLTEEYIENIVAIREITKEEYQVSCGKEEVKCIAELKLPSGRKVTVDFSANTEEEAITIFLETFEKNAGIIQ